MRLMLALLFSGTLCCFGCANQTESEPETVNDDAGETALPDSATSGETIMTAVNTHCPIMGGEITDDGGRTEWNGKTIGFCCPPCIEEWNELTEEEKEAKLARANAKGGDDDDHDHGEAHGDEESGS